MPVVKMVSPRAIERFLFSSHVGVRRQWLRGFRGDIETLVSLLADAGASLHDYEATVPATDRSFRVLTFLFIALHCLGTSSHLLISGLYIPAGNQMRSFAEALAMALLCSEPSEGVLEAYDSSPRVYPVHKAPDRLRRSRTVARLGLSPSGVLPKAASFYSRLSHASILNEVIARSATGYKLWIEYDSALIPLYRKELRSRHSAARALREVADELTIRLS